MHIEAVKKAIKSKKKVKMSYDGKGERIVCPHALYINSDGKHMVDCYQVSGYAESATELLSLTGFELEKITNWEVLNNDFSIAGTYNPLNVGRYHIVLERVS